MPKWLVSVNFNSILWAPYLFRPPLLVRHLWIANLKIGQPPEKWGDGTMQQSTKIHHSIATIKSDKTKQIQKRLIIGSPPEIIRFWKTCHNFNIVSFLILLPLNLRPFWRVGYPPFQNYSFWLYAFFYSTTYKFTPLQSIY